MESVVYDGPQPSRTLELGPGKIINLTKGEPFEVTPELAEQLLEQRHFSAVGKASKGRGKGKKPSKLTQLKVQATELGIEGAEKLRTIKAAEAAIEKASADAAAEAEAQQSSPPAETTDNTDVGESGAQKEGE